MSPGGKELGLGVVNPRSDEIETPAQVRERVLAAMKYVPAERLFLNPDCGFGTFAARPMNTSDVAARKLADDGRGSTHLRDGSGRLEALNILATAISASRIHLAVPSLTWAII
mgnify:CR=1 FL=1